MKHHSGNIIIRQISKHQNDGRDINNFKPYSYSNVRTYYVVTQTKPGTSRLYVTHQTKKKSVL